MKNLCLRVLVLLWEMNMKKTNSIQIFNMKLSPKPYDMIASGKKTIELRLLDEKRSQIKVGDIIVHMRRPVFVTDVQKNSITAVDPHDGEMKTVLLTRSPFGFDFATKVVNFLGDFSAATPDNPFGNMWMLMLANGDDNATNDLLPLMLMGGAANTNPMMLYFLLNNKGNSNDLLPLMMMMNGGNPFAAPAHSCDCAGNCGKAGTDA